MNHKRDLITMGCGKTVASVAIAEEFRKIKPLNFKLIILRKECQKRITYLNLVDI